MGDTGYSYAKAQVTAHHAIAENSEWHKSWERFPKNPRMRKGGGVIYNYAAAPRAPTFSTLPFHFPPQPSHFQIHTCFRRNPKLDLRNSTE